MFELVDDLPKNAVIKVIGVGGGGGNAVKHMIASNIEGVEFICANTDSQALTDMAANTVLQLGNDITKGLGAGANPDIGRQAALEDREKISEVIDGADMVFITAGMGGGTGTGAAPIIAEVAKEMDILTVAVVTRPFNFEGKKRMEHAMDGIRELREHVDSLITIPNEKLLKVMGKNTSLLDAFKSANDVLLGAVQGIADLIIRPGLVNVDFADVRTVMSEMGMAMMGTGLSNGESRARDAAESAIHSPLLDDINLDGARGILVNITAGMDLSLDELSEVGDTVGEFASESATIVVGAVIDPEMSDDLKVTVVATGLGEMQKNNLQLQPVRENGRRKVSKKIDYDQPTVFRNKEIERAKTSKSTSTLTKKTTNSKAKKVTKTSKSMTSVSKNNDLLDIPAFLRRQAN